MANGAMATNTPCGNFRDEEWLQKAEVMTWTLGCDGKLAIAVEGRMVNQATARMVRQFREQARGMGLLQD